MSVTEFDPIAFVQERAAVDAKVSNEIENIHEKVDALLDLAKDSDSKLATLVTLEQEKAARDVERLEMDRERFKAETAAAAARLKEQTERASWFRNVFFEKVVAPTVSMLVGGATMWFSVHWSR